MNEEFRFSEEFGKIDEKLIENAGKAWSGKKYHVFQLYSRKIVSAAAIVMICIAAAGSPRVQAAVKEFTGRIGEMLGLAKDLSSYTEIINQTQTQNGISLELKEVILDDHVLIVSLRPDYGNRETPLSLWVNEKKTSINGQNYRTYDSLNAGGLSPYGDEEPGAESDIALIQTYEDMILPEGEAKVHLVLDAGEKAPLPGEEFDCTAEFVYDFVITPEELKAQTVKQDLNITVSGEEHRELILKDLTMNDLYCRIMATGVTWDDEWVDEYDLKLKGQDNLGNPVSLEGIGFISENEMRFETDFLGDYEAGAVVDADTFHVSVPDRNCTYIDLQLYERKIIWEEERKVKGEDGEYYTEVSTNTWDTYSKKENYGWEPVGEPFRIAVTGGASSASAK